MIQYKGVEGSLVVFLDTRMAAICDSIICLLSFCWTCHSGAFFDFLFIMLHSLLNHIRLSVFQCFESLKKGARVPSH